MFLPFYYRGQRAFHIKSETPERFEFNKSRFDVATSDLLGAYEVC